MRPQDARIYRLDWASPADRRKREKKDAQTAIREIWVELIPITQGLLDGGTFEQRIAQPKRSRRRAIAA